MCESLTEHSGGLLALAACLGRNCPILGRKGPLLTQEPRICKHMARPHVINEARTL